MGCHIPLIQFFYSILLGWNQADYKGRCSSQPMALHYYATGKHAYTAYFLSLLEVATLDPIYIAKYCPQTSLKYGILC